MRKMTKNGTAPRVVRVLDSRVIIHAFCLTERGGQAEEVRAA